MPKDTITRGYPVPQRTTPKWALFLLIGVLAAGALALTYLALTQVGSGGGEGLPLKAVTSSAQEVPELEAPEPQVSETVDTAPPLDPNAPIDQVNPEQLLEQFN